MVTTANDQIAADVDDGTRMAPDRADAVRRHEVIAAIERSATTGEHVNAEPLGQPG
jgi:hypothetical protein